MGSLQSQLSEAVGKFRYQSWHLSFVDGDDEMWGDAGNDRMDGERGFDVLFGGTENDILILTDGGISDYADGQEGYDTLYRDYSVFGWDQGYAESYPYG